ncbi:hypothetical protein [Xanthomonas phage XacN1]|nr:hypothetical protein [Xanthomonas phage XacN1]
MKLDTIDVELVRGKDDRGTPYEVIELILNGEKLKNRTFDPFEFAVPRIKNANWYLMTCSCGIAGCGGYHYGVNIKRRLHTIEWRDHEKDKDTFLKPFYSFNRSQYEAVQEKCMDMIHAIVNEREQAGRPFISEDPDDYDYDRDSIINWYTVEDLNRSVQRYNDFIKKHRSSWSW